MMPRSLTFGEPHLVPGRPDWPIPSRQPEIANLQFAVRVDQQITRFQIPVNDVRRVDVLPPVSSIRIADMRAALFGSPSYLAGAGTRSTGYVRCSALGRTGRSGASPLPSVRCRDIFTRVSPSFPDGLSRYSHLVVSLPHVIEIDQPNTKLAFPLHTGGVRTHPVRFSCPPKCLRRVISLNALRASITRSNTLVMHFTASVSPDNVSCTEMTRP